MVKTSPFRSGVSSQNCAETDRKCRAIRMSGERFFSSCGSIWKRFPQTGRKSSFWTKSPRWIRRALTLFRFFEWFWNDWASTVRNLVFIVCGPAGRWIADHIEGNRGGLFNRLTGRMYLKPFPLQETEQFLAGKGITWSRSEIAECYRILGGIPCYLNRLSSHLSPAENIDCLFFQDPAPLRDEFDRLYRPLFTNREMYIRVAEALSTGTGGLTRGELSQMTGISANGNLTTVLHNLRLSGFIRVSNFFGRKKKRRKIPAVRLLFRILLSLYQRAAGSRRAFLVSRKGSSFPQNLGGADIQAAVLGSPSSDSEKAWNQRCTDR